MDNQPPGQNPTPPPSNDPKQEIAERLKQANNVLVTVSSNPSVDQLAACIGLTLVLNKMDKHATAVFSGQVPSTIEFLQPEQTLEKNTDSLRDFIIALDKAKADKLRYKVEDRVVKIFITPYRTSISEKDLEFSQGDFNVDVVVALGVHEQQDLDQAITAHGRILHDAKVTTISTTTPSTLGSINWQDTSASSLSELITNLSDSLGPNLLDGQIATALLTGIVAETARFSNEKTSPRTMSASAALMMAGANQQLVATKLEPVAAPVTTTQPTASPMVAQPPAGAPPPKEPKDTLEIKHEDESSLATSPEDLELQAAAEAARQQQIHIDNEGVLHRLTQDQNSTPLNDQNPMDPPASLPGSSSNSRIIIEPPTMGGTLTANSRPEDLSPSTDGMSLPQVERPMLNHDQPSMQAPGINVAGEPLVAAPAPPPPASLPPPAAEPRKTLSDIEQSVESPHVRKVDESPVTPFAGSQNLGTQPDLDSLSNAAKAAAEASEPLPTPKAFGSQYAVDNLHPEETPEAMPNPAPPPQLPEPSSYEPSPGSLPSDQPPTMPMPSSSSFQPNPLQPPPAPSDPPFSNPLPPTAPPPVPPPMFPPTPGL